MAWFAKAGDIKAGVVGYGGAFNMGGQHLREMQSAGMTPLAVAEIDESRLRVAEQEFPDIETYTSVGDMLAQSDVDVVAIVTPHNTHAELALECLRGGRHVVCEKPLAITTEECNEMLAEARKHEVILSTYHNRHWDGCILRARQQIVDEREVGEIVRIEAHMGGWKQPGDWWRSSKSVSGGILYDWGVHLLEYALQLFPGAKMTEVSGYSSVGSWAPHTKWKDDTNEDEAYAVVRFDTGQWLTLCISTIDSHPKAGRFEITGTRGSYLFEGGSWTSITHEEDHLVTREGRNPDSEGWRFYQNIADHLVGKAELIITPEWSRRPIHILDLADRSAKEGRAFPTSLE